jgi:hypothetical protein
MSASHGGHPAAPAHQALIVQMTCFVLSFPSSYHGGIDGPLAAADPNTAAESRHLGIACLVKENCPFLERRITTICR